MRPLNQVKLLGIGISIQLLQQVCGMRLCMAFWVGVGGCKVDVRRMDVGGCHLCVCFFFLVDFLKNQGESRLWGAPSFWRFKVFCRFLKVTKSFQWNQIARWAAIMQVPQEFCFSIITWTKKAAMCHVLYVEKTSKGRPVNSDTPEVGLWPISIGVGTVCLVSFFVGLRFCLVQGMPSCTMVPWSFRNSLATITLDVSSPWYQAP